MFVDILKTGNEVNVTTTASNEGIAWGTSGVILGTNYRGLLLLEDVTFTYNPTSKRARRGFFPWQNIAAVSERNVTETPLSKRCDRCNGSGYEGFDYECEACGGTGQLPLEKVAPTPAADKTEDIADWASE